MLEGKYRYIFSKQEYIIILNHGYGKKYLEFTAAECEPVNLVNEP